MAKDSTKAASKDISKASEGQDYTFEDFVITIRWRIPSTIKLPHSAVRRAVNKLLTKAHVGSLSVISIFRGDEL